MDGCEKQVHSPYKVVKLMHSQQNLIIMSILKGLPAENKVSIVEVLLVTSICCNLHVGFQHGMLACSFFLNQDFCEQSV